MAALGPKHPSHMNRRSTTPAVSLDQALRQSPALAGLLDQLEQSSAMLRQVRPLIPAGIEVQAGPVQDGQWCLLVGNSAGAAKVRQLLPALLSSLKSAGWPAQSIRVKVSGSSGGRQL